MTGENPPKGYDPNDKFVGDADDLICEEVESSLREVLENEAQLGEALFFHG
jgi:hypothetical protein